MSTHQEETLESWLVQTEASVDGLLKTSTAAISALKKLQKAARAGDVRELRKAASTADETIRTLRVECQNAKNEVQSFDDETYLSSPRFVKELKDACNRAGVKLYEQDDRLFCYPSVVRVSPGDKSIFIGKTKIRAIRPSLVAKDLATLQNQPPRFKVEPFLESLFSAFELMSKAKSPDLFSGRVIPLADIYGVLTMLPGQSKEYSQIEFTRDVYLLDRSGIDETRKGWRVSFPSSTGTKSGAKMLHIFTEKGAEKKYYGLSFTAPAGVK